MKYLVLKNLYYSTYFFCYTSLHVYIHSVIDEVVLCTSISGILTFYKKRGTQNYPKNYGHEFSSIFFIMNIAVACTLTYLGTPKTRFNDFCGQTPFGP